MLQKWLLCTLLFASSFPLYSNNNLQKKYYRISNLWTQSVSSILPCDINRDGIDELVVKTNQVQLDIVDQSARRHYHSLHAAFEGEWQAVPVATGSLDSVTFFLSRMTSDSIFYELFSCKKNQQGAIQYHFKNIARYPNYAKEGFIQSYAFHSALNVASKSYLLFMLNTAYNLEYDRGVLAIDFRDGQEAWRFATGSMLYTLQRDDLDADGVDEFILGTYAPCNGLNKNGTSDDSSYVFLLRHSGELIWRRAIGGRYAGAGVDVADFAGYGKKIVVLNYHLSDKVEDQDHVLLLEPATGKPVLPPRAFGERITFNFRFPQPASCADFNKNGSDEIVFGNSDGVIRMVDQNLNLIASTSPAGKEITVATIADLNGDGDPEIIGIIQSERVVLFDRRLHEMASFPLEIYLNHDIEIVKYRAGSRLLLHSMDAQGRHIYRLLQLEGSLIPFDGASGGVHIFWWILAAGAMLSLFLLSYLLRRRGLVRLYIRLLAKSQLFAYLLIYDQKGVVRSVGLRWLELLKKPAELVLHHRVSEFDHLPDEIQRPLLGAIKEKSSDEIHVDISRNGKKIPVILEIDSLGFAGLYQARLRFAAEERFQANVKLWSVAAQKLAHGIKNPLTSIKLNLDELKSHLLETDPGGKEIQHIESIGHQIDKLRRMADGFSRYLDFNEPVLSGLNLNEWIREELAQLGDDIPSAIHINVDLADDLPDALANAEQLRFAFENVLFNAVQSIQEHGTILVQTLLARALDPALQSAQTWIELRIQDNGTGIDADILAKVTEPYFTTKKQGTGLGLSLVVKIMQMFGGEFDMHSQTGEGTIVILRFKAVEQNGTDNAAPL